MILVYYKPGFYFWCFNRWVVNNEDSKKPKHYTKTRCKEANTYIIQDSNVFRTYKNKTLIIYFEL